MKNVYALSIIAVSANVFISNADVKHLNISGGSITPLSYSFPIGAKFIANEYKAINLLNYEISTEDYNSITLKTVNPISTTFNITINDLLENSDAVFFDNGNEFTVDLKSYGENKTQTINNIIFLSCAPGTDQNILISDAFLTRNNGDSESLYPANINADDFGYLSAKFDVPATGYPSLFRFTDLETAGYKHLEISFEEELPAQFNLEFKHINDGNETVYNDYVLNKGEKSFSFEIPADYETIPVLQLIHLDFLGDIEESEIITISSLKLKSDDDNSTDKEEDKENNQDETSNGYRLPLAGSSVSVNNTSNRDYRISYSNLFQPLALCDAYNTLAITEDYAGYVIVFGDNVSGRFEIKCNDNAEYLYGIDNPKGTVSGNFGSSETSNGNFALNSSSIEKFWLQRMWNTDGSQDPTSENPKYADIKEAYFIKADGTKVPMIFYGQNENYDDTNITYAEWSSYEGVMTLGFGDMAFQISNLDISEYKEIKIEFGEATSSPLTLEGWLNNSDESIVSNIIPAGTTEFKMPLNYGVNVLYHFDLINMEETITTVNIKSITLNENISLSINTAKTDKNLSMFPTNVYSVTGKLIKTGINSAEELKDLPKGIYIIRGKKFLVK